MQSARWFRVSLWSSSKRTTLLFEVPPLYLCPAARGFASARLSLNHNRPPSCERQGAPSQRPLLRRSLVVRQVHSLQPRESPDRDLQPSESSDRDLQSKSLAEIPLGLPVQCTGCGAFAQTIEPGRAGYYDTARKDVRRCLGEEEPPPPVRSVREAEVSTVEAALQAVDRDRLAQLGVDVDALLAKPMRPDSDSAKVQGPLLCDRCHNLVHHSKGVPIHHPSMEALRETVDESPYKYNHVYHVIDAADFPMSLLPNIHEMLAAMPLRSRNRRSRDGRYYKDRKTEISFIITRSDLLAPKKEQVDRMMPYLKETLRAALGRRGRDVRLGNVRCVSAKRSWWTKELKEEIWQRGGGGWMIGRVNVGKSRLFEAVFPKGRMHEGPPKQQLEVPLLPGGQARDPVQELEESAMAELQAPAVVEADEDPNELDVLSLLPPARPETNYPEMPIVSSLPGTTASPIRVPFGGGRGELIDLPGLERTSLDKYVKPEHRASLIMKSRITPEQQVMRPGTSLLLGGFIRITPRTPNLTFLSYAFTPIEAHLTRTDKAVAIQGQTGEVNVENIAVEGTADKVKHAGSFALRWDVTKARTGPITRRDAVNLKVDRLPFRVVATDILIEGCGWVELVAQVRTKDLFAPGPARPKAEEQPGPKPKSRKKKSSRDRNEVLQTLDLSEPGDGPEAAQSEAAEEATAEEEENGPNWPVVDVYSPEGKFVGARAPMNAWMVNKPPKPERGRPRRSMKGQKKLAKAAARAGQKPDDPAA